MGAQAKQDSFGGKLAKWGQKLLSGDDEPSVDVATEPSDRESSRGRFSREVERRKSLYADIGSFLFAHDLDLTPLNFGLAYDYLTGNDIAIEKAVRAILNDRGQLTNGVAETIIAEARPAEITPDSLAKMLDTVESNLKNLTTLAGESKASAEDYGSALAEQVEELDGDEGSVVSKLVALTRSMVERTRVVETQMRESQKQTQLLQRNLETARKAAEQDHLTGLPNRRAFENVLKDEVKVATANNEPLSVAFCDIDHFKQINDTHGHDTGDRVLKFVAGILAKASGDKCHVARHGGEEFVMLFRGKTAAEACKVVDASRQDMSERSLVNRSTGERMSQVTFSGGVADVFAFDEPRNALKAADRALYLAKEHGRNRIYIASNVVED